MRITRADTGIVLFAGKDRPRRRGGPAVIGAMIISIAGLYIFRREAVLKGA